MASGIKELHPRYKVKNVDFAYFFSSPGGGKLISQLF
jgi:hypothetical protein